MQSRLLPILIIPLLALNTCSKDEDRGGDCGWDSAPTATTPGCYPLDSLPAAPAATTPEILLDNLFRAFRTKDKDLYESLLDQDYWFTETNCLGDTLFENGFEEELKIMNGSRDGSNKGIFDIFRDSSYDFHLLLRSQELGSESLGTFDGDPDGHPDEDWEIFRGRVQMLMLDENGDGYRVDQVMTYKLRLNEEGLWKIIRWIDDPLSGDCSGTGGKIAIGEANSWGQIKAYVLDKQTRDD